MTRKRRDAQGKRGEATEAGKPAAAETSRLGFMAGQLRVPDDFDRMGEEDIWDEFFASPGIDLGPRDQPPLK